ncbi:MAG: hypothetical protein Q7V05_09260 [Methanoregula sp.]|nr:hypothetical protein [Methanoregula sp.]
MEARPAFRQGSGTSQHGSGVVKSIFDSGKKLEVAIGKMEDLPLYLILKTLVVQMQKMGWSVFQIIVVRKLHHKYTVKVETLFEHSQRKNLARPRISKLPGR